MFQEGLGGEAPFFPTSFFFLSFFFKTGRERIGCKMCQVSFVLFGDTVFLFVYRGSPLFEYLCHFVYSFRFYLLNLKWDRE